MSAKSIDNFLAKSAICVAVVLLLQTGCTTSRPWTTQAGAGPQAEFGDARVSGVAISVLDVENKKLLTSTGRIVQLFPKTDETTRYVMNARKYVDSSEGEINTNTLFNPEPAIIAQRGRKVYGYGIGEFVFEKVAPGDYYLFFQPAANYRSSDQEIHLEAGQDLRDVRVGRHDPEQSK